MRITGCLVRQRVMLYLNYLTYLLVQQFTFEPENRKPLRDLVISFLTSGMSVLISDVDETDAIYFAIN